MSFREKSCWVMATVMLLSALFYARSALPYPGAPVLETVVPYILLVVVMSVIAQAAIAIRAPNDAKAPKDERERLVADKAGHWAGLVMATGVILAGWAYIIEPVGNMLFHHAMLALIVAQLAHYAFQIMFLRRSF